MRKQHSFAELCCACTISVAESPCPVSPVAPFPLLSSVTSIGIVCFCSALSRHVSFHSPCCPHDIRLASRQLSYCKWPWARKTTVGKPELQNNTKCTRKDDTTRTMARLQETTLTLVLHKLRLTCPPRCSPPSKQTCFGITLVLRGFWSTMPCWLKLNY